MQIQSFDKVSAGLLSDEIERALQPIASKYGIQIKRGRGVFAPTDFTLKVECAVVKGGIAATKEATSFENYAHMIGLKKEDLGKPITFRGKGYAIMGFRPRSKYSILARRDDGKSFWLPLDEVKKALGVKDEPFPTEGPADPSAPSELAGEAKGC
jgi:hypothetical protein